MANKFQLNHRVEYSVEMIFNVNSRCMANKSEPLGVVIDIVYTSAMIATFGVCTFCYGGVLWKIRKTSQMIGKMSETDATGGQSRKQKKNNKAAQTMCFFVLAYLLQWVLYITYTFYQFLTPPPNAYLMIVVLFCNMGGVFNFFAYSFSRRQNTAKNRNSTIRSGASSTSSRKAVSTVSNGKDETSSTISTRKVVSTISNGKSY